MYRTGIEVARMARKAGNFYGPAEPKLALLIQIRGIHGVSSKVWNLLQLLQLCQIFSGTFGKLHRASINMLKIMEPYIACEYSNPEAVNKVICKQGCGKTNEKQIALIDNALNVWLFWKIWDHLYVGSDLWDLHYWKMLQRGKWLPSALKIIIFRWMKMGWDGIAWDGVEWDGMEWRKRSLTLWKAEVLEKQKTRSKGFLTRATMVFLWFCQWIESLLPNWKRKKESIFLICLVVPGVDSNLVRPNFATVSPPDNVAITDIPCWTA